MAGIYIHIPFCRKACHYCNFHFSTSLHRKADFLEALHKEIAYDSLFAKTQEINEIETLYIGGGTPSLLTQPELRHLIEKINKHYKLKKKAEITLEANPDDITAENLIGWKQSGINRLSIGIQSFRSNDLLWMNRAHNEKQAHTSIELADNAGFNNLNIDLIYGTPTLPDEAWLDNLEKTRELGITHLSCYALTVEENTALFHFIKKGKVPPPPEERQVRQFEMLTDWALANGWEHYEISNLCQPGYRSRHNSNYWNGSPYRGFGPSAHSFDGKNIRFMGIANNRKYIEAWLEKKGSAYETEVLNEKERLNEKIMTGLRRMEGISINQEKMLVANHILTENNWNHFIETVHKFDHEGYLKQNNNKITLTGKGMLYADYIASELFI